MNDGNGDDNDDVSVAILCISATAGGRQNISSLPTSSPMCAALLCIVGMLCLYVI